jgi:hypothetical protein
MSLHGVGGCRRRKSVREDNAVVFQPVVVKLRLAAAGELATEHVPVDRVNRR